MAKRLKTLDLPVERDLVKITKRWGKQVAVSPVADKGRKEGCLCIHTDSKGNTVMCERLRNNIRRRAEIEKNFGAKNFKEILRIDAGKQLGQALRVEDFFTVLSASDPCPIASVLYELAKAGPAAMGVTACAGYIPPKEQALPYEVGVGIPETKKSEGEKPFFKLTKRDILELNRSTEKLRKLSKATTSALARSRKKREK